ncbi:MAG: alpha/beta hydrolase [Chryseolinea sp.]
MSSRTCPESRERKRQAYQKPKSLKASLDWYRSLARDEKDNSDLSTIDLPVLYVRGSKDFGDKDYLEGFTEKGTTNLTAQVIESSGHYSPDEKPIEVRGQYGSVQQTSIARS